MSYNLYVTDTQKAKDVLTTNGYEVILHASYVQVLVDENDRLKVVKVLNEADVILLDME